MPEASTSQSTESPGAKLRRLMLDHCVMLPGAYDGMIARAVAMTGFEACYVSGAAVSFISGVPDVGLTTLEDVCRVIRTVACASGLPLIADADTGFGEGEMVTRAVREYSSAGAAGLHIEDQVFPKRCGHLEGKQLVPIEHMVEKVTRAAAARDAIDAPPGDNSRGSFIVCARTDARSVSGIDEAINRADAYCQAGADMIFPEGLRDEKEFESFAVAIRERRGAPAEGGPFLLANMTEFGKTPLINFDRFARHGYDCVIYPYPTLRLAMGASVKLLETLRSEGSVEKFTGQMQTRQQMYDMLGYAPGVEWTFPSPTKSQA